MPPRPARATQQNKQRQNIDRDSPAGSLDVPSKAIPGTAANSRKRPATSAGTNEGAAKKKRLDIIQDMSHSMGASSSRARPAGNGFVVAEEEGDEPFDLCSLPFDAIQTYVVKYDLIPPMYPNPCSRYTPPLPEHLLNPPPPPPPRSASPGHRARARTSANNGSRRSTRLLDDDSFYPGGPKERLGNPVMPDLVDYEVALVDIAKRHWDKVSLREHEVIEEFSWAIRKRTKTHRAL